MREVPGLGHLLQNVVHENVIKHDFTQGLLRVFRDSKDQSYEHQLARLTPLEKREIERFTAGKKSTEEIDEGVAILPSLGVREELAEMKRARLSRLHEIKAHLFFHFDHVRSWFEKDDEFDLGPLERV